MAEVGKNLDESNRERLKSYVGRYLKSTEGGLSSCNIFYVKKIITSDGCTRAVVDEVSLVFGDISMYKNSTLYSITEDMEEISKEESLKIIEDHMSNTIEVYFNHA